MKEKYQPSQEEINKAESMMTDRQKWDSEQREKQIQQLETFVDLVKDKPYVYKALMDGNRSAYLVRVMAENLKTKDGLVRMSSEKIKVFHDEIHRDIYDRPTGRTIKKQQGNIRIWQEDPKCDDRGHFDKGSNPNLIANAYADIEDIERELEELKKNMELVEENDHSPKDDWYVEESKQFTFKHREDK